MEEHKHTHITENPDSIEFGTPGKGGAIKIYHNANDTAGFMTKIKNMLEVRKFAVEEQAKMEI